MTRFYPLLFVLLWSTGFIGARYGLPYAEPLSFLCLRYGLVIVLMGAVALATRAPWPMAPRQWLHIGVTGLLVHGVYLGGVFVAISHGLPAGIAALVVGLQPLLTALGAGLLLGEKVRPRQWGGLVLGLAGVALVVSPLVVGALGALIERTLLKQLYKIDPIYGLLLTFGLALMAEGLFKNFFGVSGESYDAPELLQGGMQLGGVMTHAGGSYNSASVAEITAIAGRERDGAVAAAYIQRVKQLLEYPATLFID